MRRRELILGLAGAFATRARAQGALPVIGFLNSGSPEEQGQRIKWYLQGLHDEGFADGKNVKIEYRWARGDYDKLPALAAELVKIPVAVIAAPASTPAAVAAKAATTAIPIVFGIGSDPVELGLVASLSRPGGNITGVTTDNTEMGSKQLGLFRELVPNAAHYFVLINPKSQLAKPYLADLTAAAVQLGVTVVTLRASTDAELDAVFTEAAAQPNGVLFVSPDSFYYIRRTRLAELAAKTALPAMYWNRECVDAGGLIGYGSNFSDVLHMTGRYTGRILKGEEPADLPVVQSNKFELAINMKAAKALGLNVPQLLLAQADDVIE